MNITESPRATGLVCSYNEWDPLEEAIVGIADGAAVPGWHLALQATMPDQQWDFFRQHGGKPFDAELIRAANRDLDELVAILEAEGVTVRRPDIVDHARPFSTPDWASGGGLYAAMPRDVLLVIGDEIIEAPMAWRCRYHEVLAYRTLLKEYFRAGARWSAAPKPRLDDSLYDAGYTAPHDGEAIRYVINEAEPTFDAADFIRCGRDIFVQRSNVTNCFGIDWLRRHLGADYSIHELEVDDAHPMHIDATFMPLAPGKLLINPERLKKIPEQLRSWDILAAPQPCFPDTRPLYMTSKWISMNVLMLDHERVIVEKHEQPLIKALRDWGLRPIPCGFQHFNALGGSFHCATVDIRRRGTLQSYV